MSELLFETYSAPSISYGVDALFSYRQNVSGNNSSGLVISSGNHATHVIPVIEGRGILSQAKRLQWGGTQAVEYMLKLLQLKYPSFPSKLTLLQSQTLVWDHCYVAQDYTTDLACMLDRTHLKDADRIIQFPYTEFVLSLPSFLTYRLQMRKVRRNLPVL
jgi:actin-related protein 5